MTLAWSPACRVGRTQTLPRPPKSGVAVARRRPRGSTVGASSAVPAKATSAWPTGSEPLTRAASPVTLAAVVVDPEVGPCRAVPTGSVPPATRVAEAEIGEPPGTWRDVGAGAAPGLPPVPGVATGQVDAPMASCRTGHSSITITEALVRTVETKEPTATCLPAALVTGPSESQ